MGLVVVAAEEVGEAVQAEKAMTCCCLSVQLKRRRMDLDYSPASLERLLERCVAVAETSPFLCARVLHQCQSVEAITIASGNNFLSSNSNSNSNSMRVCVMSLSFGYYFWRFPRS